MTVKHKFSHKLVSVFVCIALLMTYLPFSAITSSAASRAAIEVDADASTMDDWQKFFPTGNNINTENAGGVWMDKSVFTKDNEPFSDIAMTDTDSLLVALSAMASNMTVTGMSSVPTDTMLVLDISDSMSSNASSLTTAANNTIKALLDSNKNARVGVVMYSGPSTFSSSNGNHATIVLPLSRYEQKDSQFLTYSNDRISINSTTYYEGTTNKPTATTKQVIGGTYTQNGIDVAKDHFNAVTDTVVDGVKRTPIMVLMSDGAPTLASTNFTNPTNSTMGDGGNTSAAMGFVTQLSMSYAKQQMEAKYDTNAFLYTLGVGLKEGMSGGDNAYNIARAVLDPSNTYRDSSANALRNDWDTYNAAQVGDRIRVENSVRVRKIAETLEEESVDRYFAASGAGDLVTVFEQIVSEISLQSKYYPTLVEQNEDLSGYVTFVDKIGKYMEVTKVEGIRLHQTLFSGAYLARNFVAVGGSLGTYDNPTALGNEMVWAVQQRLGIADIDTARTLIGLAYEHGQLSYTSDTEFSNYIGWFADEDGKFLGFWYDGIADSAVPEGAVSIMKSYGYLGETDASHGVAESDMMYATVQVKEDMATKEQTVTFAVPAALIPTVTYEVTLNEDETLKGLKATGATAPIRLVYKVSLREDINEYTVNELVDSAYLTTNTNADGSVNFYTNQYQADNTTGYDTVNTYSYFHPSKQNDKYYYTEDAFVYADNTGTLYEGTTAPTGTKYRKYTVYEKNGNTLNTEIIYRQLSDRALGLAKQTAGANTWYISAGEIHVNLDGYVVEKGTGNNTDTLTWSNYPFVDVQNYNPEEPGYSFTVGATLGNNGKLTLDRETGIKLKKTLAEGVAATNESFSFVLKNTTNPSDNSKYPAYKIAADGTSSDIDIQFADGIASNVLLKAGETLYIGGMTAGQSITVTETETDKYTVQNVNGKTGNADTVTLAANEFTDVAFVNTERGTGNLTVAKEIKHPFGADYQLPTGENEKFFTFSVTLKLNGVALANKTYGAYTTGATGKIEQDITLKHNEQITIYGLPAGTEATVVEDTPPVKFEAAYWENGVDRGDGVVSIEADKTASVLVVNDYTPEEVENPIINLDVNKSFTGRENDEWEASDSFTFELQKWNGSSWDIIGEQKSITGSMTDKKLDFDAEIQAEKYTEIGRYYYRVVEIEPANGIFGVSYDKELHGFVVEVTDENMDGALEIKTVEKASTTDSSKVIVEPNGSGYDVTANFENVYAVNDTSIAIEVDKTVVNKSGSPLATLSGFDFVIYESDVYGAVDDPLDDSVQFDLTSATGTTRTTLHYNAAGTYYYAIKEVNGGKPDWDYSDKTEYVKVVVEQKEVDEKYYLVATAYECELKEGATELSVVENDNGSTAVALGFENTYTPQMASIDLNVTKTLNGRDMNAGEFKFEITPYGKATDNPILNSEGNPVTNNKLTASNVAAKDGVKAVVDFPAMYFNEVGTFFYNVNETPTDSKGVTTDKNTYRVTVTVVDNGGTLNATYQIINVQGNEIAFVNNYTPAPVSNAIRGTKELTGRALLNAEFTFVLEELDDEGKVIETYTTENSVKTKAATTGTFTFPEITYDKAGTYRYQVTEQNSGGNATYGIIYDKTKYIVTVVITDGTGDLEGNLVVNSVTYHKGIAEKDEIIFVNEYKASPTSVTIPVNKILNGRVLSADEFSFEMVGDGSTEIRVLENSDVKTLPKLTAKNDEAGNINFEYSLYFDEVGTYNYLVSEVKGNKGGVTYDTTVFRVRVEITDDLRGQLHSSVHIYDDNDIPQASIVFNNTYAVTGTDTVVLEGNKTLNGRDIVKGEFTFELYETESDFAIDGEAYKTATNDADGEFKFELEYKPEDVGKTFYYVAKEKNAGKTVNGVAYSKAEYQIAVKVEDDGLGKIITDTVIANGNLDAASLDFTNEYKENISVDVDITKKVENKGSEVLAPEGFEFKLQKEGTDDVLTVKSDKNGKAKLTLGFTEKDIGKTYSYTLTEVDGGKANVKYSTAKYDIDITVSLDSDNKLIASITQNTVAVKNIEAEFVNEYDYTPPTPPTPPADPVDPPQSPKTGDSRNLQLLYALFFISGMGFTGISVFTKRKTAR